MIDSHAHVHDRAFDEDRAEMLVRAKQAGVETIITVGCDLDDSRRALDVAASDGLEWSIGIHPHEAQHAPADLAAAFDMLVARAPRPAVAVGETGLDYYYNHSPAEDQKRVLRAQLDYAGGRDLPLIFHQRDAFDDFVAVLRERGRVHPGVIHCFTGDAAQARVFVEEFGFRLGIGGVVTFKTAEPLREAVAAVGIEHLILETDCPYLAPIPYRGKRNEPAFITQTAQRVAEVLGVDVETVMTRTDANARALFRL